MRSKMLSTHLILTAPLTVGATVNSARADIFVQIGYPKAGFDLSTNKAI